MTNLAPPAPAVLHEEGVGNVMPWPSHEFDAGNTHWSYKGPYAPDGKYLADIFVTTVTDGEGSQSERELAVWSTSPYSGELRVSPAQYYGNGPWHKGAEELPEFQYTQETRLHPDVEPHVLAAISQVKRPTDPASAAAFDAAVSQVTEGFFGLSDKHGKAIREFDQRERPPLGDGELNQLLMELGAGHFRTARIEKLLGKTELDKDEYRDKPGGFLDIDAWDARLWRDIQPKIHRINELLERQGIMPDFTAEPIARTQRVSEILGEYTIESYQIARDGYVYEWNMASSGDGTIWIDTIRRTDSVPTQYGAESVVPVGGLLTTKPLEYDLQAAVIPKESQAIRSKGFVSTRGLLDELQPIKNYRHALDARSARNAHFMQRAIKAGRTVASTLMRRRPK